MPELESRQLLETQTASVFDVICCESFPHVSEEECTETTHLVFPYRGVFVSHVGRRETVVDANQLLFMNAGEPYRISHPVAGGDDCLSIRIADPLLEELAPADLLRRNGAIAFAAHRVPIDPRTQAIASRIRHRLANGSAGTLEGEVLTLTLAQRALAQGASSRPGGSWGKQRLVDRTKVVLASDLARRWTLAEIGAEVGVSPVYLTQVFQEVEGVPLYRYQLRLRLARALDLLPKYDDLTMLGLDLGFSSHSHFSAAFRSTYGGTPSQFRHASR